MLLKHEDLGRVRSFSQKNEIPAPLSLSTAGATLPNSCLPTSSASWYQLSNPSEVENRNDLLSHLCGVRFIAISGKRKCGKDYFAELLRREIQEKLAETAVIVHISEPIKRAFAEENHLDLNQLMSSSTYKENYRRNMVRWGEAMRRKDSTIFCRKALEYLVQDPHFIRPSFVIIADCRRPSDLEFFSNLSVDAPLLHLRITATPATRRSRGWFYSSGIDNAETECALDTTPFDVLVLNESPRTLSLSMANVRRAIVGKPLQKLMTL